MYKIIIFFVACLAQWDKNAEHFELNANQALLQHQSIVHYTRYKVYTIIYECNNK